MLVHHGVQLVHGYLRFKAYNIEYFIASVEFFEFEEQLLYDQPHLVELIGLDSDLLLIFRHQHRNGLSVVVREGGVPS